MNMKELIVSIIGEYVPVSVPSAGGGSVYLSGAAGVDWAYVGSVVLLIVLVWSCFRLIGMIFRR